MTTEPAAARPSAARSVSKMPALVVLGVAVALIAVFGALSALTTPSAPNRPPGGVRHVKGSSLLGAPAAKLLAPIERAGTPPGNILDALLIPAGSTSRGYKDNSGVATQYDEQITFSLGTSQGAVVAFFHAALREEGWGIDDVGPARDLSGGVEVLGQKAGNDGWYWEAGVIVSPTTFPSGAGESTSYTLKLLEVPDTE